MRIRTGVFLAYGMIVAFGFTLLVQYIVDGLRPRYLEAVEEGMVDCGRLLSHLIADHSENELSTEGVESVFRAAKTDYFQAQIYGLMKTRVDIGIYVTDSKGMVIYDSTYPERVGEPFGVKWRDVRLTLQGHYGARTTRGVPTDPTTAVLYVASPIEREGKLLGVVTVYKATDNANHFISQAAWKISCAGVAIGGAMLLASFVVSFWVSRPIERLTRYARAVRDGENVPLPRLGYSCEIRQMGTAFDEMRDALEGRQYVENYVQNLTHEIKSPLSTIQGAAELLQEPMEAQQRVRFAENIHAETRRIASVVDKLLLLSSLEARKGGIEKKKVDWARIIEEALVQVKPLIEQKRLTLESALKPELFVSGESYLIRQAIDNLIHNAIEFSPEGSCLHITACEKDGFAEVRVEDEGPGIPEYALSRIYERFYSLPRPGTARKSSGLGLTFVKEVAELHQGKVTLGNRDKGGTVAVFAVPLD
jgi:two-component system sensor histidine kinase CreC